MNTSVKKAQFTTSTVNDPRWASVAARSAEADGNFYYSVRTTGIYCRPSCAARLARPENVSFYATREEAEKAGFRPCKRCQPDRPSLTEQYATKVTQACRVIEETETAPILEDLAKRIGMSPYHFHRIFKQLTGLTPRQYAAAEREKRVRNELGCSGTNSTITRAIFDAGYNSSGSFYEKSNKVLGMTPSNYRAGGTDTEIRFAIGECSWGSILVAQSDRGICAILLGNDADKLARDLQDSFAHANLIGGDADFEQLVARVVGFVEAPDIGLNLPLDVRGTAFQQRVWQALREIPVGQTASYTDIAKRIGLPKAARAVAQACAANTLAVAIPCHRVIRNDGALSGVSLGSGTQARLAGERGGRGGVLMNALVKGAPAIVPVTDVAHRVQALGWEQISSDLDAQGYGVIENLVTSKECDALAGLYALDDIFRGRVVMSRHGFGRGEYKYFSYPLPDIISELRTLMYPHLVPIANRWNTAMHIDIRYPAKHADFIERCHAAGQLRPTPLLLQYKPGDYNCLHQDLYGEHAFPIQITILLSEPGRDFTGGEFVLTEQRPRMQSRIEVVPLRQGGAVAFAVHHRPVQGGRGVYQVNFRHGVSRLRSGHRHTAGIIFHDAT